MTGREIKIREELAGKVDEEGRRISVHTTPDAPPLMIVAERRPSPDAIANLKRSWEAIWKGDGPGSKILLLEPGLDIFQSVEGEWRQLKPSS